MSYNNYIVRILKKSAKQAGADFVEQPKKSSIKIKVIYLQASNRAGTRIKVQRDLTKEKVKFEQKKTSLSSEDITEIITKENLIIRIAYKPKSGGMTETTLNSTITELTPCLMFLNNIKESNVEKLYEKILKLDLLNQDCYVNNEDAKSGKDFIERFDKSSKFKEKIENAIAINNYLLDTDKNKKIKNVYWAYRAKPLGMDKSNPGDIVLQFVDDSLLGVSLKAGQKESKEPLLNTYVNKIYEVLGYGTRVTRLSRELYSKVYLKLNVENNYDALGERKNTHKILEEFEKKDLQKYNSYYDQALSIIRNRLIQVLTEDSKKFIKYVKENILGQQKLKVPVIIIKAIGRTYEQVKDRGRLNTLISQTSKVKGIPSLTSKQNFYIQLLSKTGKKLGEMEMAVRSNKVGVEHKLGQFYNLAVKYNGLDKR